VITDLGLLSLSQGLMENNTVTSLEITSSEDAVCTVGDIGIYALLKCLLVNQSLTSVHIQGN
jgi:hypothetical protein